MKIDSLVLAVAVIVTGLSGCSDSEGPKNLIHDEQIAVAQLDAPATVAPGGALDIVLTVDVGGCVRFDHIAEVRTGSQINLEAWGKVFSPPLNGACEDILIREPHSYRLEPPFPEKFTIIVQPISFGVLLSQQVTVQ